MARERDRVERRKFEQQYAAEEQAAEEARLVPVRQAEAELSKTAGKLLKAEKETALYGTEDKEYVTSLLSPAMRTIRLGSIEEANEFNHQEALKFVERTPDFYQSPNNAALLANWCHRNDVLVCDAASWLSIYRHLDSLGLMEHRPAPQPELVIEQQPASVARASRQPEEFVGIDLLTGQSRLYTRYEVEQMSSETYKRAFRIPSKWQAEWESHQTAQAEYEQQRMGQ
jgi:hypothetical protein